MSSLKFIHGIKALMVMQMQKGNKAHGPFDPFLDKQKLPLKAQEEAADSGNYDIMEAQKVVCQYNIIPEDKEHLLKLLDNILSSSLMLGVQWLEYEQALKEVTNETSKSD